jgi:transcriptional regulator with GAF, ATPase, and Fis domain
MATAALAFAQLANDCEADGLSAENANRIADELAKAFNVHADEVAILRLERTNLRFVYPTKLGNVGSIPLNTTTSVAARTATTKRAEAINNFAQTKHASIFEAVELGPKAQHIAGQKDEKHTNPIQKLMTVPVVTTTGVLGVIQVCRTGKSAPESGADFAPPDLQRLVAIATALAKCFK